MIRRLTRLARAARRSPVDAALSLFALLVGLYVVGAPLLASRYPAMTDFPFHAAQTATLRHYFDPEWHFREQFDLHPIAVPYLSMYALGALFMLVLPGVPAVKLAAFVMLALLPVGLGVMFHGMKKSPLLGLAGLGFVWCNLTHWGFLNFMGALGLFAMAVGLALLTADRPTRARRVGLAITLVLLFFTHVFRFPMAIVAVLGAAVLVYPETKRIVPVLAPLAPSLALFAIWLVVRPTSLQGDMGPLALHTERLDEIEGLLFGGLRDPAEAASVALAARILAGVAAVSLAAGLLARRATPRAWSWTIGAGLVPLCCAGGFLLLFLVLPMQIGDWWYVYPREAVSAAFIALAALPDLPRSRLLRAPLVAALAVAVVPMAQTVARSNAQFGAATDDFHAITRQIPQGPRLLYLVFDHTGSNRTTTPFIHLPAYVQAERGGWLSFHFAVWNASPIAYKDRGDPLAVVPPATPNRWEWTPQRFDVRTRGAFFDWFLVRQERSPDRLFAADPTIERVDHVGSWWLYRRRPAPGARGG